jgi:hypothetical protein
VRRQLAGGELARSLLEGPLVVGELEVHSEGARTQSHLMLMVVLTPPEATSSSNQREVTVLVCV